MYLNALFGYPILSKFYVFLVLVEADFFFLSLLFFLRNYRFCINIENKLNSKKGKTLWYDPQKNLLKINRNNQKVKGNIIENKIIWTLPPN